ncbi:MAG TPA: RcnB family protein [Allosphingosinicella sp.]|nr:RcnB family protein [Allosphingosinicella sp.]
MRRALIGFLLAATAAMPVAAQAQEGDAQAERVAERYRELGERNQARSERRQEAQAERAERREVRQEARQERVEAPAQQQQGWTADHRGDGRRGERRDGERDARREAYRQRVEETRAANQQSIDQSVGGNYARQGQRNQERVERQLRQDYGIGQRRDGRRGEWNHRDGRGDWYGNRDGRGESYGDRDGRGDRYGDRRRSWNHGWRNDRRYDWQRYRYSNRDLYRSGRYYSPYRNHRYNRLSIGIFLGRPFYSNNYWLNDPWQYRLPMAPYGTQWVRYYNDVVLVDVYTGEVIDVIYDFFW